MDETEAVASVFHRFNDNKVRQSSMIVQEDSGLELLKHGIHKRNNYERHR